MSDPASHERLVEELARSLAPIRRLPGPGWRALVWSSAVLALGLLLLPLSDAAALQARLGVPDLRYAALGAILTSLAAAFAAFQSSVPGRSRAWALLPIPPLVLWIGVSGLGCLRAWLAPASNLAETGEMRGCFVFLMGVSLPLSVLLAMMLRRACPLNPSLTAALGGLAVAAAAAALLVPFHPHDATATDLAVHLAAVLIVVGLNGLLGGRFLEGTTGRRSVATAADTDP
ncbi:NrsF family protein [Methylobacterium sp. 10]|uniref:NrsF family protein n=1 Tax=Methylobacterium sp. 10 TaxID=1101191 RepID=UPI00048A334C|nr:NrsF family protein [Methylobacterium sp. 10]